MSYLMSYLKPRLYRIGDVDYIQVSGDPLLTMEEYSLHQVSNYRAIQSLDRSLAEVEEILNKEMNMEIGMKLKEIIEICKEVRGIVAEDTVCFNLRPGKDYDGPMIILRPARDEQFKAIVTMVIPAILLLLLFTSPYALLWRIF
ncbi:hypothetical protein F5Y00DRAFT_267001 [Daldinia vernicosa]|uniref:uncharacterized protein n=1 Tax=Daldinia vernicosa TaxID=114800 RepID=UPI002008DBF7|nr:uncharacterized protein F5Y00DRAFT_267001 [Daldinia vernicosa]KAI0843980.1 hypothetical protein F5Y00DRAFT_267001 [Daldinia vernicosa]